MSTIFKLVSGEGRNNAVKLSKVEEEKIAGLPAVGKAMRGLTLYFDTSPIDIPYRIFMSDGFKIVLHDPDLHPLPLSSGFMVAGETTVEVEISKNVKEGLPPPFDAFGSGACVDTESEHFENPLKRYPKYSKELCEAECFVDYVVQECGGCRHFFHPGNESVCHLKHLAQCFRDAEVTYYGGGQKNDSSLPPAASCNCLMPCRQEFYSASVSSAPFRPTQYFKEIQRQAGMPVISNIAYVHFFYSDPVVTTMKQVAIYSTEGLLGNIGGQIGLFMGFSLVTVAEMLELIFLLVTRGRSLKAKVKQQKEVEALVRASMKMNT
ncbi:acid-sensing ion channel 1-like [Elysia marginata]|uniref:Acid-sensing ion channel 1-like n=1 Tax=Elysia marginata TaxID=1093978 RepID=A0AAV4JD27_9GAST|nr:acid-sensing ion channel 1-like [Elysia marginata]